MDLKALYPQSRIVGIDNCQVHLDKAMKLGLIDECAELEDIADSDLVIIAIPVDAGIGLLMKVLDQIGDQTLVIDAGSTK